jgi:peptide/nickel transport system ATP-binding protein
MIDVEAARESTTAASTDGGAVAAEASTDAVVAELYDRLFDEPLAGENRNVVETALADLAADEWDRAADRLRDRFESVCERVPPELDESSHPAACHLVND